MGREKTIWLIGVATLSWGCSDMEMLDLAEVDERERTRRVVQQPRPAASGNKPAPVLDITPATTPNTQPEVTGTTEPPSPPAVVDVFPNSPPSPPVSTPRENPNPPTAPTVNADPTTSPAVTEPAVQPKKPEEQDPLARKLISDNPEDNLEVLNMALERWIEKKGELPERLEQLVMEEFLPMLPMEPVGKTFAIDRNAKLVVLVQR